jgi:hypothetical protein
VVILHTFLALAAGFAVVAALALAIIVLAISALSVLQARGLQPI